MKPTMSFAFSLLFLGGWATSLFWLCTTLNPNSPSVAPVMMFALCGWLMWCCALPGSKKHEDANE